MAIPNLRGLIWTKGTPLKKAVSETWIRLLASILQRLEIYTAEGSGITLDKGPAGTRIGLARHIPESRWFKAGSGGIPARNASTGEWGEGLGTPEVVTIVSGKRRTNFSGEGELVFNKARVAVPANAEFYCLDDNGDLIVHGWVCP